MGDMTSLLDFKATLRSVKTDKPGTIVIHQPRDRMAFMLTNILISVGKNPKGFIIQVRDEQGRSMELFNVGQSNTVIPFNFHGVFKFWKDARLELINAGPNEVNVTVSYISLTGENFTRWQSDF